MYLHLLPVSSLAAQLRLILFLSERPETLELILRLLVPERMTFEKSWDSNQGPLGPQTTTHTTRPMTPYIITI